MLKADHGVWPEQQNVEAMTWKGQAEFYCRQNKVSGSRWIAKRANNETKDSHEASRGRLTKPKHVDLLGSGINTWDFAQRHSARPKCSRRCS